MKPLIGSLFGGALVVLGLSSAVVGLSAVMTGDDMAAVHFTVGLAIAWTLGFIGWTVAGKPAMQRVVTPEVMAALARRSLRRLDRTRQFPEVNVGNMILPDGERALLSERSSMRAPAVRNTGNTGGSHVSIGKQSFQFGRVEAIVDQARLRSLDGRLVLTDRALVFFSDARSFSVDLANVTSIEPYSREAIVVCAGAITTPSIFVVANPILWSMVVRMAAQVPLTDGLIPTDVSFDLGATSALLIAYMAAISSTDAAFASSAAISG